MLYIYIHGVDIMNWQFNVCMPNTAIYIADPHVTTKPLKVFHMSTDLSHCCELGTCVSNFQDLPPQLGVIDIWSNRSTEQENGNFRGGQHYQWWTNPLNRKVHCPQVHLIKWWLVSLQEILRPTQWIYIHLIVNHSEHSVDLDTQVNTQVMEDYGVVQWKVWNICTTGMPSSMVPIS